MKLVYKSLLGIFVIALLFVLCNLVYEKTSWQQDAKSLDDKLLHEELEKNVMEADVLYFAESSNATTASTDTIKKSISQLTNDCFPDLRIKAIDRGAIHAGVFLKLMERIPENASARTVIVTMNLRSFDSNWIHSLQENYCQHLEILYSLQPALYKKMRIVFQMYDHKEDWERKEDFIKEMQNVELYAPYPLPHKTVWDWDVYTCYHPFLNEDGTWNNPKTELACTNVKIFGFNIDTLHNPRIKDFDEIVKVCKQKKIKLYFNLLAENTQYADSLVGKELTGLMRMNRDLLVHRYHRDGVEVIDNLELVDGKDFVDQNWTSEHYNQTGRIRVAKNLADKLRPQFSQYYKACPY